MKPIDKLNEDFFDNLSDNDFIDEPVDELIDDSGYTYNIHFIIYTYPFIKDNHNRKCVYYFEDPKYKPIIESGFISIKKALECILQATPIVSDYSKPKFCSSSEKLIEAFPFMNNKPLKKFETLIEDNFVILETTINLSRRKNEHNILKMFYSFYRLQQIYDNLLTTKILDINMVSDPYMGITPYINIGVYKEKLYKKLSFCELTPSDKELTSGGLELTNLLNSKDETDE